MVAIIIIIVVGIILLLFAWLIFWPWVADVDTTRDRYLFYQRGTVRLWLTAGFQPHLQILGISVPLKSSEKEHPKTKSTKHKERKRQFQIHHLLELWTGIVHSITVRWFYLDLDTGDVVLNAQLVPVFFWMSRGPLHLTTNVEGRIGSRLRAEIKLYRMGWAFLLFFIKK
jgi:hypothetical protein